MISLIDYDSYVYIYFNIKKNELMGLIKTLIITYDNTSYIIYL